MKTLLRAAFVLTLVGLSLAAIIIAVPVGGLENTRAELRAALHLPATPGEPPAALPADPKTPFAAPVAPATVATAPRAVVTPGDKPRLPAPPAQREINAEALRRVSAWYADGGVKNDRKMHVVYFMPTDRPAYPEYRERYTRILNFVKAYYAREMVANGLPPMSFNLDTGADGLVNIHLAHGDKPLSGYNKHTNAGRESREAAFKALREAGIDPENNQVLIVCQMTDGISPYYGGGPGRSGGSVCWVCDLPGLDSDNLTSRINKKDTLELAEKDALAQADAIAKADGKPLDKTAVDALVAENRAAYRGRALGPHTSVYIGGITHELGHCFNLPHTGESPDEQRTWGVSLMGQGTFTFAEELRDPSKKGSFLVPADALSLVSLPLFIGMDKEISRYGKAEFGALRATPEANGARITGKILSAEVPVYGVIVTCNLAKPAGDYHSNAAISLVDPKTGEFSAVIERNYDGPVDIMLTALHMNGKRTAIHTPSTIRSGHLNSDLLNRNWLFADARRLLADGKTAEALASARSVAKTHPGNEGFAALAAAWERALAPKPAGAPPAARSASEKSVSLADCAWSSAKTGYGSMPASRDLVAGESDPIPDIGGRPGPRALVTHAPGAFVFDLAGKWKTLAGNFGLQTGAGGSVGLDILGDGKVLRSVPVVSLKEDREKKYDYKRTFQPFSVDVTGVKTLELRVTDGGDGNGGDHGVIADPVLSR